MTALSGQPPFARRLLDALPFTVWSVDLDGKITATNTNWSRFAIDNGAPAIAEEASVRGCSVLSSVDDDAARDQMTRAMTLLREKRASLVRWEFPCNSPTEERVFLMQVTPLETGDAVTGFVFSTVDITPSHRSREALINTGIALSEAIALERVYEEVAKQLRRVLPATGFVIALTERESTQFDITHREGFGAEAPDALAARLTPAWLEALASGAVVRDATGAELEITAPLMSAEGVVGALTLRTRPPETEQTLEEAVRVLAVIAAQTAVAIERAWLVRRVEQKRRLETIGEVAAGVAHELRNPLFGISSAAQLLQFRAKDDPVVEKNVGRILREVERLNRMATSLLEFGRPSVAQLRTGDPEVVWDDILDGERARLEARQLTLVRTRPAAPLSCELDPEQMGQVCRNILVNACEHAPDGSTLTLVGDLHAGSWRSRLTNGGPPMPADVVAHAFEFFYSAKPGGSGIGLALCQRIMHEHGGTIAIESGSEGTTLTLTLTCGSGR